MGSIEAARVEEEMTGERSENERGSTYCEKCKMDLAPFLKGGGEYDYFYHESPQTRNAVSAPDAPTYKTKAECRSKKPKH